ncbi:MAG TPA: hypothetical protein ENI16_00015 [Candidatus Portnoybacteria bacterium]|nr:hypothetical protein [Candidatus Portnoybacteria bacterium]
MKLDKKAFGLVSGVILGVVVFIATIWVVLRGGGNHLRLLDQFYLGYSISYLGAVVGLIYGFVTGFISCWIFAALYNVFAKCCEKSDAERCEESEEK